MTVSANEDYLYTMIAEAEGLTDLEYSAILDKAGPLMIGGFRLWPSDVLKNAPDYCENGLLKNRGQMFDDSKQTYIEKVVSDCKTQINALYEEDVIF
jgi:hypothetical protein